MDATGNIIAKLGTQIIDPILLLIFAAGFFMFMWGLFEFMVNSGSGESVEDGKRHMIYGTLGMFIMVSVYGIIALLDNTFGLNVASQSNATPTVNTQTINFTQ